MGKKKNLLSGSVLLVVGLFVLAFGIALSTKSGLGVSPSASLAYVLSEIFPLSMGTFTTLINVCYVVLQIVILNRHYHPSRLLQLVVVFLFGYFTDFTLRLVAPLEVSNYFLKLLLCVISCGIMGFGVFLEVKANVIVMASEGAISVIAEKTKKEFGQIKIVNDCICVVLALVLSLIAFHEVRAVREGTVIAAFLVGLFTQFYNRHIHVFDKLRAVSVEAKTDEDAIDWAAEYPLVVTIEREFGSGGHEIGEALAKKLGIGFYDYNLIEKTAKETGLPSERVRKNEERIGGVLYALYNQNFAFTQESESTQDAIFDAQKKILRDITAKESCVVVGRLSSYILRMRPNTLHIFISAKEEFRAKRIAERAQVTEAQAMEMVKKEDELRHSYCRHFTGQPWGLARHYRLCLDTSAYGLDESLRIIGEALKDFQPMYLS